MAVRDRSSPADSPLYTRGEPDAPGEVVPRGPAAGAGGRRRAGAVARVGPAGAGRVPRVRPEPADRPGLGEPGLAAPVRAGAGADARTTSGPAAPRRRTAAARRAGRAVHGRRVVDQAAGPPAGADPGVRAGVRVRRPQPGDRPGERAGLAGGQPPAGRRGHPRRDARGGRQAGGRPTGRVAGGGDRRRTGVPDPAVRPVSSTSSTSGRSTCRSCGTICRTRWPRSTSPSRAW